MSIHTNKDMQSHIHIVCLVCWIWVEDFWESFESWKHLWILDIDPCQHIVFHHKVTIDVWVVFLQLVTQVLCLRWWRYSYCRLHSACYVMNILQYDLFACLLNFQLAWNFRCSAISFSVSWSTFLTLGVILVLHFSHLVVVIHLTVNHFQVLSILCGLKSDSERTSILCSGLVMSVTFWAGCQFFFHHGDSKA